MTAPRPLPPPFVVEPDGLDAAAVLDGAAAAAADVAVVEVTGSGAIACLQGLLTNDVDAPGDGAFLYGAVLTPKGMIVCDLWASRTGGAATLVLPRAGREPLLEICQRSLPPRLARATDRSHEVQIVRVVGPRALERSAKAGYAVAQPASAAQAVVGGVGCLVSRPASLAPFALQMQVSTHQVGAVLERLQQAGVARGGARELEVARILAGWPRLGAEIDQKTLPQEVRYDELNAVSYTKGCYTGQETVARLHFRGHPNRGLVGLAWERPPDLARPVVTQGDREVGRVSSAVWLDPLEQFVGLGIVRREVDRTELVMAAGSPASIVDLPFDLDS